MATVLADVATIAGDTAFKSRVAAGIAYKSNFISTQTLAMENPTEVDKLRLTLARNIMLGAGTSEWIDTFAWAVAADPNIADTAATDEDILATIDALWNVIAGQTV